MQCQRPALLFFAVLALVACSGPTQLESDLNIKGAPDWVNKGTAYVNNKDGRLFHGVSSAGPMGDEALQRAAADDRARAEVARIFSSYLDVVSRDYQAASRSGDTKVADEAVSRQIKNLTQVNLSGAWNDTDSRLVSEEMIQDVLARPWVEEHSRARKQLPAVIVGEVRNLSHEHINVATFVADMERALINSGKAKFVASRTERGEVREERRDQELHAREDTRKPMGQELGADYMLQGSINTIIDAEGKTQVRYYQVDLTLISLADNTKIWIGQKKIKKLVKGSNLRF